MEHFGLKLCVCNVLESKHKHNESEQCSVFFFFWEGGVNGELDDDLDLVKEFPKGRERGTREGEVRILIHGNVAFLTPNGTINIVYMLVFHSTTNYK